MFSVMIGDHHQLPPVIKNMAFQKYSNMEQSLFTRFVRLGVPTVDLDAQGNLSQSCSLGWLLSLLLCYIHVSCHNTIYMCRRVMLCVCLPL